MAASPELHLIVPGACGPLAETRSLQDDPVLKSWIRLLSRAHCAASSPGIGAVIAEIFDLPITGDFPRAAFCLLAHDQYDAEQHYICADPVHLQADLERAILTSNIDLAVSEDESATLYRALNSHFVQDGLRFIRTSKDNWFVVSRHKIRLSTTPLVDAVGRNVNFILPKGDDATFWKQMLTEAQMLMHAHEVNARRESQGRQSINSLWLHGCGELPGISACRVGSVCSDDDVFKGVASHVKCDYKPLMSSASEYLDYLLNSRRAVNVLHLAALEHSVNYSDVSMWRDKLAEVLDNWIYPLIKMANKNNLRVLLYPCNERQYCFSKYDALKFWRQKALETHVSSY